MPTNEGRKGKVRRKSSASAQSRGDEAQAKRRTEQAKQAGTGGAEELHVSVSCPEPAARAAEAAQALRGETERPFKGWPAQAGRPRGRLLDAWHATYSDPLTI